MKNIGATVILTNVWPELYSKAGLSGDYYLIFDFLGQVFKKHENLKYLNTQ
jgi:hypothetical protein